MGRIMDARSLVRAEESRLEEDAKGRAEEQKSSFSLGTNLSKVFVLPPVENTICIDIQGITATPTDLKQGFLGLAYSKAGLNFFNVTAPKKIAHELDRYKHIYLIWQGDEDLDKKVQQDIGCDIHTGIGSTISILYNILQSLGKSVTIICISKEDECCKVEQRLSLRGYCVEGDLMDNNIFSKIDPDNKGWRDELIDYYGTDITKWGKWNGSRTLNDRLENLIKQYISNLISNKTFILDYGQNDSISSHFNQKKHEEGNVIHITP